VDRAALRTLSRNDLVALIEAQAQQIAALTARVAELEGRLAAPTKTPDNSSLPPSKGQKPNLPDPGKKKPRPSRPGVARALAVSVVWRPPTDRVPAMGDCLCWSEN